MLFVGGIMGRFINRRIGPLIGAILICFLWVKVVEKRKISSLGLRAAWNFTQANIFGFSVSGLAPVSDSLLKFSNHGSNLLTGGEFGPEASIFYTVVLSLALIILVYKFKTKKSEITDIK